MPAFIRINPSLMCTCSLLSCINLPSPHSYLTNLTWPNLLSPTHSLVSYIQPAQNKALLEALAARRATVLGMDCIPRTIRWACCRADCPGTSPDSPERVFGEGPRCWGHAMMGWDGAHPSSLHSHLTHPQPRPDV